MNKEIATQIALNANVFFNQQSLGYLSWGEVDVLQIAIRLDENCYLANKENSNLANLNENDLEVFSQKENWLGEVFLKRKNINFILITKQEFASQVKEEIPPILDDQAQLLGVTIRKSKDKKDILQTLKRRFVAILSDGTSLCIGNTLEDAYVAAQLLEKTAKAFVEAKYLGGAKPINKLEAWAMQQFFLFKYSKEAQKNK